MCLGSTFMKGTLRWGSAYKGFIKKMFQGSTRKKQQPIKVTVSRRVPSLVSSHRGVLEYKLTNSWQANWAFMFLSWLVIVGGVEATKRQCKTNSYMHSQQSVHVGKMAPVACRQASNVSHSQVQVIRSKTHTEAEEGASRNLENIHGLWEE